METPQPLSAEDVATLAQLSPELPAPASELVARLLQERGRLRVTARNLLCQLPPEFEPAAEALQELVGPPT